jgi:hypothetical protein
MSLGITVPELKVAHKRTERKVKPWVFDQHIYNAVLKTKSNRVSLRGAITFQVFIGISRFGALIAYLRKLSAFWLIICPNYAKFYQKFVTFFTEKMSISYVMLHFFG